MHVTQAKISFRKRLGLAVFRQYKRAETRKHTLRYLMWECTVRCNFNCKHCGSDCRKEAQSADMPVSDFLAVVDNVATMVNPMETMIVVTGGEPLLRTDLELVGAELNRRHFPWGMVTNGYLLSQQRLESLILAGLQAITISLDGFEQSHNWLRGIDDSFFRATNAIARVAKTSVLFDVVTCVNRHNFSELEQIRLLLIQLGVTRWRLFTIFPIGRAALNDELNLSDIQFRQLFNMIQEWRKQPQLHISYGCEGFLGNFEAEVRDQFYFCRAGINIASVLVDGSVSGCNNINHRYIQGNIYDKPFTEIWRTRFQLMRERSWMKTDQCENCKHFNSCQGNAFHLRNAEGKLLFCHLSRLEK